MNDYEVFKAYCRKCCAYIIKDSDDVQEITYDEAMKLVGESTDVLPWQVMRMDLNRQRISIKGKVCPVGGVYEKVLAAKQAGIKKVFIPKENMQELLQTIDIEIIPVEDVEELITAIFNEEVIRKANSILHA